MQRPPMASTTPDRNRVLYEVAAELTSSLDLDQVLRSVLDRVLEMLNAARGFIVLIDPETRRMRIQMARGGGYERTLDEFKGSRTVVERVVTTGTAVITTDATADERFSARQSVIFNNLRSILAVPLAVKGRVIGALYVDNPFQSAIFGDADKELLQAIANQAAIAIENTKLLEKSFEMQEALEVRKLVERAKGCLMQARGISEEEAFRLMQRQSMDTRKSMREIAEAVILTVGMERRAELKK
jgi:GAF domain-containing protein